MSKMFVFVSFYFIRIMTGVRHGNCYTRSVKDMNRVYLVLEKQGKTRSDRHRTVARGGRTREVPACVPLPHSVTQSLRERCQATLNGHKYVKTGKVILRIRCVPAEKQRPCED